jgi:TonB family protein
MKRCPTCLEEFADKFGFCPVDGTPLNGHVPESAAVSQSADESATMAAASSVPASASPGFDAGEETFGVGEETVAASAVDGREEFHLTILEDVGLTRRLSKELKEVAHDNELNWKEFKRNPGAFTHRAVTGYGRAGYNFFSQRNIALATFAGFFFVTIFLGVVFAIENKCNILNRFGVPCTQEVAKNPYEDLELVGMVPETEIPKEQEQVEKGPAGTNEGKGGGSKPKYEKPAGGGGGGRQEMLPASAGKLPTAVLAPVIMPASPRPPTIKNPSLPMPATMDVDPMLIKPDLRDVPYGLPNSTSNVPSSGPGTGGGMGTGSGGGMGSGDGGGLGPGRGGNTGGGDRNEGGGGPGGGGGGNVDYNRTFQPREVTAKAVIISKPEPGFTEEARKNNVTGLVRLRAVLSSGGAVQNIAVIKGLPDGLTEKAIAAARSIKFRPAQKDGRTVSQWVTLEYNFNIY